MKPLSDLPLGHPSRNGSTERPFRPSSQTIDDPNTISPREKQASSMPGTASVQSMLRNGTEVGLASQFAPKHAYKPRSALMLGNSDQNTHISGSHGRHMNPRSPLEHENVSMRHKSEQSALGPSSFDSSPRQLPYAGRVNAGTVEEYRSWSMTQRSYALHALNRHPNQTVTYHSRGIAPNGRPRSPYAYPTRLKRPGYRPSSPSWSDINRAGYSSRANSRPCSPASTRSMNCSSGPWQEHVNHSDPMLMHYPPYLGPGNAIYRQPSPSLSQAGTSRPTPSLRSIASSSRLPRPQRSASKLREHRESFPASPIFYDYSEGFEEIRQSHDVHLSSGQGPEGSQIEEQTGVKSEPSPFFGAVELPTEERGDFGTQSGDRVPLELPESTLGRKAISLPAKAQPKHQPENSIKAKRFTTGRMLVTVDAMPTTENQFNESPNHHVGKSSPTPQVESMNGSVETKSGDELKASDKNTNFSSTQQYEESTSSSTGSMRTAESKQLPEDTESDTPSSLPSFPLKTPGLESLDSEDTGSLRTITKHVLGNEEQSQSDGTEIISPTPERSILSTNSRHRFSKILGLNDDSFVKTIPHKELQHAQDDLEATSAKFDQQARDSVANNGTIESFPQEESDSEEPMQLSPSLMKTFGQLGKPVAIETSQTNGSTGEPAIAQSSNSMAMHTSGPSPPTSQSGHVRIPVGISLASKDEPNITLTHSPAGGNTKAAQILVRASAKPLPPIDKELPTVPEVQHTVVAIPPPHTKSRRPSLPFAFMPISQEPSEQDNTSDLEAVLFPEAEVTVIGTTETNLQLPLSHDISKATDRESVGSSCASRASRPWNRDSNYPWNDESLDLNVVLPPLHNRIPSPLGIFPRFKLRIHRASTSSAGTGRLTKSRNSSDSSRFPNQNPVYKMKGRKKLAIGPGQENSSHAIGNETKRSRFVESFDSPPQLDTVIASPTITLVPPSPGHEVHSFFSDDSSQARQKGSLRKRLSEFKARHSQTNSTEEFRGYDRGRLNSAFGRSRASGRTSRQSQTTAGAMSHKSQIKHVPSWMFRKVRFWWNRSEDKVRDWNWKLRHRPGRSPAVQPELYPGT